MSIQTTFSGAAGVFVGHPFDTTKVVLQTAEDSRNFKTVFNDITRFSWRGFYRGLSFPLLSSALINSVYFGVYTRTLNAFDIPYNEDGEGSELSLYHVTVAGLAGGFAQWPLSSPIECIKTTMQSQLTVQANNSKLIKWKKNN